MKSDKIVIVGGGSAGWMAASALIRAFPDKDISLIESDKIPIVGVGESTTFEINGFFQYLGIDYEDFMKFTNATYKVGIGFTNFKDKESKTFFYPFGVPFLLEDFTWKSLIDWYYKKTFFDDVEDQDYVKYFFPQALSLETNKILVEKIKDMHPYNPEKDLALQIDAHKFGQWLAENYAIPRGVKRIVGTVEDIVGDNNIEYLVVNGQKIYSDIFVDCSGFNSILLGGFMKEKFISTKNYLPNNRAWTTHIPYENKELELQNFTNCTGLDNGWVWNIPLWNRTGSGYVYCNEFISDEDALEEYKRYLDSDQMIVPNKDRSKNLQFRKVEIKNGYYEKFWSSNVVGVGLASGFLEPLESTGLLITHQTCMMLINALSRGKVSKYDIDNFNYKIVNKVARMFDFVALHYALSQRDDTEYWRSVTNKNYPESYFDESREWANSNVDSIFAGFGINKINLAQATIQERASEKSIKETLSEYIDKRKQLIIGWENVINKCPTQYEYLKNTIYLDNND